MFQLNINVPEMVVTRIKHDIRQMIWSILERNSYYSTFEKHFLKEGNWELSLVLFLFKDREKNESLIFILRGGKSWQKEMLGTVEPKQHMTTLEVPKEE